jgi:hypothetical protein
MASLAEDPEPKPSPTPDLWAGYEYLLKPQTKAQKRGQAKAEAQARNVKPKLDRNTGITCFEKPVRNGEKCENVKKSKND